MRTYNVGRKANQNDIVADDDTVSSRHAEITVARDNRYFFRDRLSMNGSHRLIDDAWQEFDHGYLKATAPLRLGELETTIADLMRQVPPPAAQPVAPPPPPPPPETLEPGDDEVRIWDEKTGRYIIVKRSDLR